MNKLTVLALILIMMNLSGCVIDPAAKTDYPPPQAETTGAMSTGRYPLIEFNPPKETRSQPLIVEGKSHPENQVYINGQLQELDPEGVFQTVLYLEEGINRIPVKVSSPSIRYMEHVEIEYKPLQKPPQIDLDLLEKYFYSHIIFEGRTDPGNQVWINNIPVRVRENGEFITDIVLVQGIHLLNIKAVNSEGISATVQKTVQVVYPVENPVLIVALPEEPGFISSDQVKVNGFTNPANLIEIYNNYYESNGQEVLSLITTAKANANGGFAAEVRLNPGPNKLIIRALNARGLVTEKTRKIYCKNNEELSGEIPKGNGYGYSEPNIEILIEKYPRNYDEIDAEDE